jgi:phage terminase Nu1 subunit (DNA packaging protein)
MADMRKDLARALGVSAATVTRDAAAGMPTDSLEAARDWRQKNRRARVAPPPRAGHAAPPEGAVAAGPPQLPDVAEEGDYWHSRARREAAEAKLAELKLAELQGVLVRADDVRASLAKRAAAFREGLLQIPARLSAQLAAELDQAKVHALIDGELRTVMGQLVQGGE